ncbi:MAG: hypothetical protein M9894_31435 [Planctomycetes bacterium]|nr:hypothetical protein [Planctomycetota bacterium]
MAANSVELLKVLLLLGVFGALGWIVYDLVRREFGGEPANHDQTWPLRPVRDLVEGATVTNEPDARVLAGRCGGRRVEVRRAPAELVFRVRVDGPDRTLGPDLVRQLARAHPLAALAAPPVQVAAGWLTLTRPLTDYGLTARSIGGVLGALGETAALLERAQVTLTAGGASRAALARPLDDGWACATCRQPLDPTEPDVRACPTCDLAEHERCLRGRGTCAAGCKPPSLPGVLALQLDPRRVAALAAALGGRAERTEAGVVIAGRDQDDEVRLELSADPEPIGVFPRTALTLRLAAPGVTGRLALDADEARSLAGRAGAQAAAAGAAVSHLFGLVRLRSLEVRDGWLVATRVLETDYAASWGSVASVLDAMRRLVPLLPRAGVQVRVGGVVRAVHAWSVDDHVVCPFCRDALGDDAVEACPVCDTAHHRDCLAEAGGCTVLGCAGRPPARERTVTLG